MENNNQVAITMRQYRALARLADFAQWFVDEHKGASGDPDTQRQWDEDHADLQRGLCAIVEIENQLLGGNNNGQATNNLGRSGRVSAGRAVSVNFVVAVFTGNFQIDPPRVD